MQHTALWVLALLWGSVGIVHAQSLLMQTASGILQPPPTQLPAPGGEAMAPAPASATPPRAPFQPPREEDIPAGPLGEAIRYGQQLLTQTQVYAKAYVGNGLNCTSCHLQAGRMPNASPWVGIWGVFPDYNARSGRIISLQDRINA